ncbi:DUF6879 family protein [Streptomyces sp. NPDC056749]|uniref:DUF6879 family protein n=1 Tax=Streptomyces sp. NPDC056749 TaxID=3345936 RepID=UPI0036C0BDB1
MPELTPFEDAAHHFEDFAHTAWRLETQRGYAVDRIGGKWRQWQAGEPLGYDSGNPWHFLVRRATEAGKRFERVRLVDAPPTEGQRYLLASARGNVEAGEDIRNMHRAEAERHGLPTFDFWLFDSRTVVEFVFDDVGNTRGVYVRNDPADVLAACQARDAAWHYATPTAEFTAQVPSAV